MTDTVEREKTARQIARTQASIRRKHRALKTHAMESELALEKHYQPIVEPLKQLVAETTEIKQEDNPSPIVTAQEIARSTLLGKKRKLEKRNDDDDDDDDDGVARRIPLKAKRQRRLRAMSEASFLASTPKRTDVARNGGRRRLRTEADEMEDEVFATGQAPAITTKDTASTSQHRDTLLSDLGPLGQRYVGALLSGNSEMDYVYGVYITCPTTTMLGDKQFVVNADDSIVVGGSTYNGTPGLYELIFMNKPVPSHYTDDDLQMYRSILLATNAYRKDHSGQVLGSKG